jgi:hypothetical protein
VRRRRRRRYRSGRVAKETRDGAAAPGSETDTHVRDGDDAVVAMGVARKDGYAMGPSSSPAAVASGVGQRRKSERLDFFQVGFQTTPTTGLVKTDYRIVVFNDSYLLEGFSIALWIIFPFGGPLLETQPYQMASRTPTQLRRDHIDLVRLVNRLETHADQLEASSKARHDVADGIGRPMYWDTLKALAVNQTNHKFPPPLPN